MCIRKENETTRMLFYNQYTFSYRSVVSRGIVSFHTYTHVFDKNLEKAVFNHGNKNKIR